MWYEFYAPIFASYAKNLPILAKSYNILTSYISSCACNFGMTLKIPTFDESKLRTLRDEASLRKRLYSEPDSFEHRLMRMHCICLGSISTMCFCYCYTGLSFLVNILCISFPFIIYAFQTNSFEIKDNKTSKDKISANSSKLNYWFSLTIFLFAEQYFSEMNDVYYMVKFVYLMMILKVEKFSNFVGRIGIYSLNKIISNDITNFDQNNVSEDKGYQFVNQDSSYEPSKIYVSNKSSLKLKSRNTMRDIQNLDKKN